MGTVSRVVEDYTKSRVQQNPTQESNCCRPLHKYQFMPYLIAVVDCTHVESATAFFKEVVTVAQENSTNQTADVLVRGSVIRASFGFGNGFPGARTRINQAAEVVVILLII